MAAKLESGIHVGVPMADYIADPAREPSLNASTAHLLVTRSPLHCWHASPRLNPQWRQEDNSPAASFGTVVHHLLLGADERSITVIDAEDFRKKEAKEARDSAIAAGQIPILAGKYSDAKQVAERAREQLDLSELSGILNEGDAELTLISEDGGIWTRGRPDWWTADHEIMLDLKTTTASAEPNGFIRQIINMGYDLQAVIATNAAQRLTRKRPQFIFAVIEQEAPYGLSLVGLTPTMMDLAQRKLDYAEQLWAQCLRTGKWTGYPSRVCWAEPPAYHVASVEELIELGGQA